MKATILTQADMVSLMIKGFNMGPVCRPTRLECVGFIIVEDKTVIAEHPKIEWML